MEQGGLRLGSRAAQDSVVPHTTPAPERIHSDSTLAFTQLASSCARSRTTRRSVPVASHPGNALDGLRSWATLDRSPPRTARPLEEHGWTHHKLPTGPAGWRTRRHPRALQEPASEAAPSPSLSPAAPPMAACQGGSGRPGRTSPIARAGTTPARPEPRPSSPAVPSPCHPSTTPPVRHGQPRTPTVL